MGLQLEAEAMPPCSRGLGGVGNKKSLGLIWQGGAEEGTETELGPGKVRDQHRRTEVSQTPGLGALREGTHRELQSGGCRGLGATQRSGGECGRR